MTRTEALQHGMQKKWDRHFKGRTRLIAQWCVMGALLILAVNSVLWTQLLFPETFNSIVAFELILDAQDQEADDWTYKRFQVPRPEKGTTLHKFFIWHVLEPVDVLDSKGVGSLLDVEERGPYAVRQVRQRYDISFNGTDDSELVTYKEFDYFEPVGNPEYCRDMFQRTNLGLAAQSWDSSCPSDNCARCQDLDEEVTVINPHMVKMLQDYGPEHILAVLAQEAFHFTEVYLTEEFPKSVKAQKVETAFDSVFKYRKAVQTLRLVQDAYATVVANNGTAVALDQFTLTSSETYVKCGDAQITLVNWGGRCPWGAGSEVNSARNRWNVNGTARLKAEDLEWMFDESWAFSLFNESVGMPLWISAARYLNLIDDSLFEPSSWDSEFEQDDAPQAAFNLLANATYALGYVKSMAHARAEVNGVVEFIFDNWYSSALLNDKISQEWASLNSTSEMACDVGGYASNWAIAVPIPPPGLTRNFSIYRCNWALAPLVGYYTPRNEWTKSAMNISLAAELIDPDRIRATSEIGLFTDQGRVDLYDVYTYCNATSTGQPTGCAAMDEAVEMFTDTLPRRLARWNGEEAYFFGHDNATRHKYQDLACGLAAWLFEGWTQNNRWMDEYVAHWMSARLPVFDFSADRLEDLGYAQFAGGYVTEALFGEPGVASLLYDGYWKFAPEKYQLGSWQLKLAMWKTADEEKSFYWSTGHALEFHVSAIKKGYPLMNLTVEDGTTLLQVLAADTDVGITFREHIMQAHSTYYCGGPGMQVHDKDDNKYECEADEAFFTVWNPFADFTWDSSRAEFDVDDVEYGNFSLEAMLHLGDLMNESFVSTDQVCDKIEGMKDDCLLFEDDTQDTVQWVDDCEAWATQLSNPYGIYCGENDVHKRGNIVAHMIHSHAWDLILTDGYHLCDDPDICTFDKGGFFTTVTVRNLLFESRVDSIAVKMLNHDLQDRNLSVKCVNQSTIEVTDHCGLVKNHDCTDDGFHVLHEDDAGVREVVLTVDRTGDERWQWYRPEIVLPRGLGEIKNPAYSTHAGQMWNNESFHKNRLCEHRILGGPKGRFQNCEIVAKTGRHDLSTAGHVVSWYGNTTLEAAPTATAEFDNKTNESLNLLEVSGTQGDQYTPYLFNGFKKYYVPYLAGAEEDRYQGTDFRGNASETLLLADQLLVLHMERYQQDFVVRWPYPSVNGSSPEFSFRANRYQESEQDWLDAQQRTGSTLRDLKGMPYFTPTGMSSAESLAGVPAFYSTVRFYGNSLWGNAKERQKISGDFAYAESTAIDADNNFYAPTQFKFFVDIEPVTGKAVRKAHRLQLNFRAEANALFPFLMNDDAAIGCTAPSTIFLESSGYGCFVFHPLLWEEHVTVMDHSESSRLKYGYLDVRVVLYRVCVRTALLATLMLLGGLFVWRRQNKAEAKFRARIYLD